MKYYLLLFCILSFQGCNPYYKDLGDGFFYCSDKDYGVDELVYDYSNLAERKDSIVLQDSLNTSDIICINNYHHVYSIVPVHVESFDYDEDFILAQQKSKDKFLATDTCLFYEDSYKRFRDEYDFFEYWIIDKKQGNVYGPLSFNLYKKYRERLNVPDELQLSAERNQVINIMMNALSVEIYIILIAIFLGIIALPFIFAKKFMHWKR
jgi:hypothetical protein